MDALSGDVETRKALAADVAVARHAGQQLAVYYKNKAFLCLLKGNPLRWPLAVWLGEQ
jgi:hypothetical protein